MLLPQRLALCVSFPLLSLAVDFPAKITLGPYSPPNYAPPPLLVDNHNEPVNFNGTIPPEMWYPARDWHNKFRKDPVQHQNPLDSPSDLDFCIHVRPGFRLPSSLNSTDFLGEKCTHLVKKGPSEGFKSTYYISCGDITENGADIDPMTGRGFEKTTISNLVGYYSDHYWNNAEHCRAGCETCFDSMAEFGAEMAICQRNEAQSMCGMGFVRTEWLPFFCSGMHREWGNLSNPLCDPEDAYLDFFFDRWKELGYENPTAFINSGFERNGKPFTDAQIDGHGQDNGDLRVYYGQIRRPEWEWWNSRDDFKKFLQSVLDQGKGKGKARGNPW